MVKLSRKSPVEHTVHRHKRKGKYVEDFQRGKGKHPFVRKKPKKMVDGKSNQRHGVSGGYLVRLHYDNNPTEKFDLGAKNFQDAQRGGFNASGNPVHPRKVSVRLK